MKANTDECTHGENLVKKSEKIRDRKAYYIYLINYQ